MYAPTSHKIPDNRQIFTGFVGATLCGCPYICQNENCRLFSVWVANPPFEKEINDFGDKIFLMVYNV